MEKLIKEKQNFTNSSVNNALDLEKLKFLFFLYRKKS